MTTLGRSRSLIRRHKSVQMTIVRRLSKKIGRRFSVGQLRCSSQIARPFPRTTSKGRSIEPEQPQISSDLLLLLNVNRVPPQFGAVLFQLQLFRTGSTTNGVIVIASLFTNQKYGHDFLLTLGHSQFSAKGITIVPTVTMIVPAGWGLGFYERFRDLTSPKIRDLSGFTLSCRGRPPRIALLRQDLNKTPPLRSCSATARKHGMTDHDNLTPNFASDQPAMGPSAGSLPKIISFSALVKCGDEVWIEHGGSLYRLRRTKQDKLILTK